MEGFGTVKTAAGPSKGRAMDINPVAYLFSDSATVAPILGLALVVALAFVLVQRARLSGLQAEATRLAAEASGHAIALTDARAAAERRLAEQAKAEAERDGARAALAEVRATATDAERRREESVRIAREAEQARALALQELDQIRGNMTDWTKTKEELLASAKAAVLQTSSELSSKLLADHKQETEAARKRAEETTQATAKQMFDQFEKLVQTVATLDGQVSKSGQMIEGVVRALSSPGGAGQFGEIGLENTLKSLGLEAGRDFVMQFAVWGEDTGALRPDAVVFLPGSAVMIIDSKASKFLLEAPAAEGTEAEGAAYANLARTMNQHLKSLAGKDYRNAVVEACKRSGRDAEIQRAVTVMCLPSEAAIERLMRADPSFAGNAARTHIVVSGPIGLQGLIGIARIQVDLGRQAENQRAIAESTSALLDAIVTALGHAEKVGRGLQSASDNFATFAKSINARLLPRARALMKLGVRPGGKSDMPGPLPVFQLNALRETDLIEGEATEVRES